jgi:acyl-CoA reductase-like NAD-dependent aldehyde dehydrogenase
MSVYEADKFDVDKAVNCAHEAYVNVWCEVTPYDRSRLMFKLADLFERDIVMLSELVQIN